MKGTAILLSNGVYDTKSAKTSHGLIRGSERFEIKAVIDHVFHGNDAGELLDGVHRDIPVYPDVQSFLDDGGMVDYLVVGIAPKGGRLPERMRPDVLNALSRGISLVSGLHQFLAEDSELMEVAKENLADIHDIRKPRPKKDLNFWKGDIFKVTCPKIVVMGTDCGLGKRTTAKFIVESLRRHNYTSEMIFTGQTGWMQGWKYGFILDSTVNDFVSGELEYMIVKCFEDENPDMIVVEGQAALRNISGPCGSEFLISGNMDGVILQHAPGRKYYDGFDHLGVEIPPLQKDIDLIHAYNVPVLAITINTTNITIEQARAYKKQFEEEFNIPVILPVQDGVDDLIPHLEKLMKK